MNSFCSASFDKLADLLLEFPIFSQRSHFVFVPGPNDPVNHSVTPRHGIPDLFTAKLRHRIPNVYFGTNPCR
jgi:DNA polymerase epsilon subunit 2